LSARITRRWVEDGRDGLARDAVGWAGRGKQYLPARPTQATDQVASPAQAAELIDRLRADDITLIYDAATRTLRMDTRDCLAVTVG
jgi:hypothetical protein